MWNPRNTTACSLHPFGEHRDSAMDPIHNAAGSAMATPSASWGEKPSPFADVGLVATCRNSTIFCGQKKAVSFRSSSVATACVAVG